MTEKKDYEDYEFRNRSSIYEIEQIAWSGDKGQRCYLLIEAYSAIEAIELSGGDDGVHEVIGVKKIGDVCIKSKRVIDETKYKIFESDMHISSSKEYSSSGSVNVAPDKVQITAEIDKYTFKKIMDHIDKSEEPDV